MTDELGPGSAGVDPRHDPDLLENGDTRNVVDKYRMWTVDAIREDLDRTRAALHIAIENLEHDLNIGSIVRTGNAFNVGGVHIVGRRRWNRRGAMVTDRYLDIIHQPEPGVLAQWATDNDYAIVGIDNVPGCTDLEASPLPERSILVFGQESNGISQELLAACQQVRQIPMYGSTRSMNVAAAAAIAIHSWSVTHQYGTAQPS
ncbi:TrmH family RNA methyltransferase [Flaviflexus massiliensis]|uniref:TrmH family RNA methyltransferase n=1 Tax=Flaviflexus massiliensis TaxID=1522309 RepID=UPI0006D5B504|nr:TrmH family RNA methyltransferase [Flaviflexus massiliensis]